jgi:hypothetical protein
VVHGVATHNNAMSLIWSWSGQRGPWLMHALASSTWRVVTDLELGGAAHSRKRGTVPHPLTRERRPGSRVGVDAQDEMI